MRIQSMVGFLLTMGCLDSKPSESEQSNVVFDTGSIQEEVPDRDLDGDGYLASEECDDGNNLINPGQVEICDGLDNDCDGEIDEGVTTTFYIDDDEDGFGNPDIATQSCSQPPGYVTFGTDCNDDNPDIFPSATEVCNEIDDNCDGFVDENLVIGLYFDSDGDGHGDPMTPATDCLNVEGFVVYDDDCDDSNSEVHPYHEELCDGIDNNCNGVIDDGGNLFFYADNDGDGFGDPNTFIQTCETPQGYVENNGDCNDLESLVNPNGVEYCNNMDDNCDTVVDNNAVDAPTWYYDIDGDGFGSSFITVNECTAPVNHYATPDDCDDTRASVNPNGIEICNNLDDDCSGTIDDNATNAYTWYADYDNDDFGDPNFTQISCIQPFDHISAAGDCNDSDATINPAAFETCNSVDDNCDGFVDNNATDALTFYADTDGDGFGDPLSDAISCTAPSGYVADNTDCDDVESTTFPGAQEYCDGIDSNCDGNNFYELDLDSNGLLACEESIWIRNSSANSTSPYGACSQAANYLINDYAMTIHDEYHGNTIITSGLLENFGLYVHHGNNMNGALGAYTNSEATALEDWVYNGGRLLFIGFHSTEEACEASNSIPYQFGVSCALPYFSWNGDTSTFVSHPITDGLGTVGGLGGENWNVTAPAQVLASVGPYEFLAVVEYGQGKVVLIADEWPYYNPRGSRSIAFASNRQLVQNIWAWLLE